MKRIVLPVCFMMFLFAYDSLPSEKHLCQYYKASQHYTPELTGEVRENVFQYDVQRYELDLTIQNTSPEISGNVTIFARAKIDDLSEIVVHLADAMEVDSVSNIDDYSHAAGEITIELGQNYQYNEDFSFTITYQGDPENGAGFWSSWNGDAPHYYTLSEPYNARNWWPCKDFPSDKASSAEIRFTVEDALTAVSNGSLEEVIDNGDGTHTFVWEENYPITSYLISLAAANYIYIEDEMITANGETLPLKYWIYQSQEGNNTVNNAIDDVPDMITCFEGYFGFYPFASEKYGMASFTWGGAMEHQTVSSMGSYSNYIVAHELAHQWWGDMITCRLFSHIWLNEGFATYSEALWREFQYGIDSYHNYMSSMDGGANGFNGSIFVADTSNFWNIFSGIVYDKGAWVLHMLRRTMGDENFFLGLQNYYEQFAYTSVLTEDFAVVMSEIHGEELQPFFDAWIYGERRPKYLHWTFWQDIETGFELDFNLQQVQMDTDTFFPMPVDVMFSNDVNEVLFEFNYDVDEPQMFIAQTEFLPTNITLDPFNWILNDEAVSTIYLHEGDVNMDENVDVLDVLRTVSIIVETGEEPSRFELSAADYSNDEMLNVVDIVNIVNYILSF